MERKKFNSLNIFFDKIILGFFIGLLSLTLNFVFSQNLFAKYKATLSASVDNAAVSVNGNQVINSTNKTTEIPLNLTVIPGV